MKLQILVPHYKEKPHEIEPLLDSLAIQQGIDFNELGVIIAYDGDLAEPLPVEDWGRYPFEIIHLHADKGGVSATRNAALDAATADYVMFCDADDMFYSVCGLYIIFNEIKIGFDTLTSLFIEESRTPDRKEIVYINHEVDSTFVHGKVHRRGYLIDNNIRFNPALTIHEDSYFNIMARELAPVENAKYCPTPFYLWKWRDESVCRHDPDYILKTYNNMIDSNDALVDQFQDRGVEDKARFYVGFMVMDAYYTMNKKEWIDKTHKGYRRAVENRFAAYFRKHRKQWSAITEQERMMISNGIRARSVGEGMPMESVTMDDWLDHIERIKT